MAGYETEDDTIPSDELNKYFNMKQEKSWKDGEPVQWWSVRHVQFPCLSKFACNIHCIPGKSD